MKKIYNLLLLAIALVICASCNDEWEDEQFEYYVSLKAPINDKGVSPIYIRYKPEGKVTFQLPVIVSGSNNNGKDLLVNIGIDSDTLDVLNVERFGSREELFYQELPSQYYGMPKTIEIPQNTNVALLPIDFTLSGLDMVNKWMLPVNVLEDPSNGYQVNSRKHYRKALLNIRPFNDYSGEYSATAYKVYFEGSESEAIVPEFKSAYVVDENTVFFYAGLVDEDRTDRKHYKIFVKFDETGGKALELSTDNPDINLEVVGVPNYLVDEAMDVEKPYLKRKLTYINLEYKYTDYTSVPGVPLKYIVKGTLVMERKINIQIPDEDQAIIWE